MSDPIHITGALGWALRRLADRIETDEQRQARLAREQRDEQARMQSTAQRRLALLKRTMPRHYAWAQRKRAEWTPIREALRVQLEAEPRSWVLMGSPPGNAKTTAMVAEAIRAIKAGRSVIYVAAQDWRELVVENRLGPLRTCDLLLADQMHELPRLPDWIRVPAMGVFDDRYLRGRQVIAAGNDDIDGLVAALPAWVEDRFDLRMGDDGESQRRKKER
jgi:hypothetical protein